MYVLYVFFFLELFGHFLSYLERNVFLKLNISWCKWAWDWRWDLWETLPQNQRTIVNNLGLPVFFMIIIFHNCTSNKWRDGIQCPVVFLFSLILFSLNMNVLNKAIVWWSVFWFLYWSQCFKLVAKNLMIFTLQKFYSKTFRSRNSFILDLQDVKWTFGHNILMSCWQVLQKTLQNRHSTVSQNII